MYKSIVLVISIILAFSSSAQLDKERFQEIFKKETKENKYQSRDNHSSKYTYTAAQEFPSWLVNPPMPGSGEFIGLGISDPGLDSADAMNMAVYRAQIMAYMLQKSTTQFMVDFFTNEITGAQEVVYEHFARVFTKMPEKIENCEVIKTYTNKFDETFVLVKYKPNQDLQMNNNKTAIMELFKNEMQAGARGQYESVYELLVKDNLNESNVPMMYRIVEFGSRNDVEGTVENEDYAVPIYSLRYEFPTRDTLIQKQFSHGIWKEVFKSTVTQILNKARKKPEIIKDMSDDYQAQSTEKLTRGISSNKMSFIWVGIGFKYDQIKMKLKEVPTE